MKVESWLFSAGVFFFVPLAAVYTIVTDWREPVGSVAVFDHSGRALGLGEVDREGRLHAQRLFTWACVQPPRVVIAPVDRAAQPLAADAVATASASGGDPAP